MSGMDSQHRVTIDAGRNRVIRRRVREAITVTVAAVILAGLGLRPFGWSAKAPWQTLPCQLVCPATTARKASAERAGRCRWSGPQRLAR
jgi:hypothetical protein